MKTTIFATILAIAALSNMSSASAQATANVNLNNNQQILDTGLVQRLQCQRNPRACAPGSQAQPSNRNAGNRRGGQQGGQARP